MNIEKRYLSYRGGLQRTTTDWYYSVGHQIGIKLPHINIVTVLPPHEGTMPQFASDSSTGPTGSGKSYIIETIRKGSIYISLQ